MADFTGVYCSRVGMVKPAKKGGAVCHKRKTRHHRTTYSAYRAIRKYPTHMGLRCLFQWHTPRARDSNRYPLIEHDCLFLLTLTPIGLIFIHQETLAMLCPARVSFSHLYLKMYNKNKTIKIVTLVEIALIAAKHLTSQSYSGLDLGGGSLGE